MSSFKTKNQIKHALSRGKGFVLESSTTVNGAVGIRYDSDYKVILVDGFANTVEKELQYRSLNEVVSYLYRERKRIIEVR